MNKTWHIFIAGRPACENVDYQNSKLQCEVVSEEVEEILSKIEEMLPELQRVSAVKGRCPKKVTLSNLFS